MMHVRLPSGQVIDLAGTLVYENKGDICVDTDPCNEVARPMRFGGEDASALRHWMSTVPELRTEAHFVGRSLLNSAPVGTRLTIWDRSNNSVSVFIDAEPDPWGGTNRVIRTIDGEQWDDFDSIAQVDHV
jgi:hypothetical protein